MVAERQRPDPNRSLVGFRVGDVAYAVPINQVKEIVNPLPLTELPHAPATIAGVADHRGEVVPVVDLRLRFDLPPLPEPRKAKWILVEVEGRTVGLVVDRVTDVFGTGGVDLKPAPMLGGGERQRGIAGVAQHDGALTFVLDVSHYDALTTAIDAALLLEAAEVRR
jgi:purine-binding chemotaxis protein CheW